MVTQEFDLNLIPLSEPVVVHINQYDEGAERFIFHLYNGDNPYAPVNATVKIQGTKPDGNGYQYYCTISGSTVTADLNIQMSACAGIVPSQIIVTEYTGVTGTFAFNLDVQATTLPLNINISETDIPIYTQEAQEAAQRALQSQLLAQAAADEAEAWSSNPPYIGTNLHWFVYDTVTEQFVDTGIVAEGKDGNKWYKGTAISGGSSTPTVFPDSGISYAYHNDFYLNTSEGAIYACETEGNASVATWAYQFVLSGGGGGVSNYNDLTNKPQINGVTLTGNKTTADLGIKSGNVLLTSVMHIGGETQSNVQEALEALDGKDAGGSFIKVTTSEASLYGDAISLSDGTTTITTNFDSTGHAEFNGVMMTGNLTLTTGSITRTVEVPYFGNYDVSISLWSATIAITTDSTELYGETITVKDANNQIVATTTFSNSGTASVMVGAQGIYTVYCSNLTPQSVSVTAETTYFVAFHLWSAVLNISTSASSLYGKTITIKKGSTTVGTTAFSAQGSASYTVHETGTYTCECEGYSGSATVSAETTYNVTITTVETYHLTVDIYSAASDTLSYTDDNGAQTVTTDSTGKATGVSITITEQTPGHAEITFTSSVAKDPTSLSNDYSKIVTLTSATTTIYVMPEGAVYWWGNLKNVEDMSTGNGWAQTSTWPFGNPSYSTNSVSLSAAYHVLTGIGSAVATKFNKVCGIATGSTFDGGTAGFIMYNSSKTAVDATQENITQSSIAYYEVTNATPDTDMYSAIYAANNRALTINALWTE